MTDTSDQSPVRIARLERRVRVLEAILAAIAFGFSGFSYKQLSGSFPLKGSSLHIEDEGEPVLDVSRIAGSSVMFLWGKEQKNSASLHAGAGGPSLILSHDRDGSSVVLAAGEKGGFGAISATRDGRNLIFGVNSPDCADTEDIFVVRGDDKTRMAPVELNPTASIRGCDRGCDRADGPTSGVENAPGHCLGAD